MFLKHVYILEELLQRLPSTFMVLVEIFLPLLLHVWQIEIALNFVITSVTLNFLGQFVLKEVDSLIIIFCL